jgi:6-phosphogluconolactonase (cycloisomerase 2 family)
MLGTLTFMSAVQDDTDGVDGLRTVLALAISPDGAHLYASGSNDNAIAAFKRDANTGALAFIDVVKETAETPNLFGLLTTHSVAVSPDGAYVYASGQADHAVAVFRRNRTTGTLEFIGVRAQDVDGVDGLLGALWVAISPDGGHVYVTGTLGNSVAAFSRDAGSGALTFLGAKTNAVDDVSGLAFARAAAVSPDGKFVYVGGASSNAIAVFRLAND